MHVQRIECVCSGCIPEYEAEILYNWKKKLNQWQGETKLIFQMAFCIVIWVSWGIEKNGFKTFI